MLPRLARTCPSVLTSAVVVLSVMRSCENCVAALQIAYQGIGCMFAKLLK